MNADRRRFLVGVLLSLLAVKFAIMPWIESQSDSRERLDVLTKRLDRSVGVVLNRSAITSSAAALEKANRTERAKFPEATRVETFRLWAQQRVTGFVQAQALQLEAFDWILDQEPGGGGLGFIRGRITIRGDMRNAASLLGNLEGSLPNMVVREVSFTLEPPARGPNDVRVVMTLVADYYFRGIVAP